MTAKIIAADEPDVALLFRQRFRREVPDAGARRFVDAAAKPHGLLKVRRGSWDLADIEISDQGPGVFRRLGTLATS